MVSERNVFLTAQQLIKQQGDSASTLAALRANELLAKGDAEGRSVWLRVVEAIRAIRAHKPAPGAKQH